MSAPNGYLKSFKWFMPEDSGKEVPFRTDFGKLSPDEVDNAYVSFLATLKGEPFTIELEFGDPIETDNDNPQPNP